MKKVEETLRKLGKDVMERGDAADEVVVEVTADVLLEMVDKAKSGGELQVGVCNVVWAAVNANFGKMGQKERDELKAKLIALAKSQLEARAVEGLADAIVDVYRRVNCKWPELVEYVFETKPRNEMLGCVFVRFMATTNSAFQRQNSEKIVPIILDLIENVSVPVQTALVVLLAGMCERAFVKKEMFEKMWTALIHIVSVDPERANKLYGPLEMIYGDASMFEREATAVSTLLGSIKDDWKVAQPLLLLIPFLPEAVIRTLLEKLAGIGAKQKKCVELMDYVYQEAPLSEIPDATFKKVVGHFKKQAGEDGPFAVYAALAVVERDFSVLDEISKRKSVDRVVIALKALGFMSDDNVELDFSPPDGVMDKVVDMLSDKDAKISGAACECIKALIKNDAFVDLEDVQSVISKFDDLGNKDIVFDLLCLWAQVDMIDDEVKEAVLDFVYCTLTDETKYDKGCTKVFTAMAKAGAPEMVQASLTELLPRVMKLIDSKDADDYLTAARAMILFIEICPDEVGDAAKSIAEKISKLCAQAKDQKSKKVFAHLLAAIVGKYQVKALFPEVLKIMEQYIQTREPALLKTAAVMGKYLVAEKKAYDILMKAAMTIKDHSVFNKFLKTLTKFVKHNKSCDGVSLAKSLLSGAHPIFKHRPPSAFTDTETLVYTFLASVKCDGVEDTLLEWFDEAPTPMLGVYLVAFEKLKLNPKNHAKWAKLFNKKMLRASPHLQEIMVEFVLRLIREDKASMDIHIFISQLLYLWNTTDDSEDALKAALASGMFELVSMGAELDAGVIDELLEFYPFGSSYGRCEGATVTLMKLVSSGKWESIHSKVALGFASVLQSDDQVEAAPLSEAVVSDMVRTLKQLCKSDSIRKAVQKQFPGLKATLS